MISHVRHNLNFLVIVSCVFTFILNCSDTDIVSDSNAITDETTEIETVDITDVDDSDDDVVDSESDVSDPIELELEKLLSISSVTYNLLDNNGVDYTRFELIWNLDSTAVEDDLDIDDFLSLFDSSYISIGYDNDEGCDNAIYEDDCKNEGAFQVNTLDNSDIVGFNNKSYTGSAVESVYLECRHGVYTYACYIDVYGNPSSGEYGHACETYEFDIQFIGNIDGNEYSSDIERYDLDVYVGWWC